MFCSYLKNPYYWKLYSFYEIIGIFVLFCIYIFKVFEYIVFCKYILFVNVFDIFEKFNFCCWKSWYFCANILKKKICFDFFWKFQENKYFRKCWHFLKKIKILERLRLVQFVFFSPLKKKKTNKQFWSIFRGKMFWALLHVQNFFFPPPRFWLYFFGGIISVFVTYFRDTHARTHIPSFQYINVIQGYLIIVTFIIFICTFCNIFKNIYTQIWTFFSS